MTLQQKLLAKQSKKGFTLVELVVVIAILAILAAIAIPSVIGIINSASESAASSNASQIDTTCKDFYAGVSSGSINASNPGALDAKKLPAKGAPNSTKVSTAKALTVADALVYGGLTSTFSSDSGTTWNLSDYQSNDKDGTITWVGSDGKVDTGCTALAATNTMADLYPNT